MRNECVTHTHSMGVLMSMKGLGTTMALGYAWFDPYDSVGYVLTLHIFPPYSLLLHYVFTSFHTRFSAPGRGRASLLLTRRPAALRGVPYCPRQQSSIIVPEQPLN